MNKFKTHDWDKKRLAIIQLIIHLNEQVSSITLESNASSLFLGAAALYRCNRYLRAIDVAVEAGVGDTAGGSLRTLFETWILGHRLMLGSREDALKAWGESRGNADKYGKANAVEFDYPDGMPDGERDTPIEQRAKQLSKSLEVDDPDNAQLATLCYNQLYRAESLLSSHASTTSILAYAKNDDQGTIGLHERNEGTERRTLLGGIITMYFAQHVFGKAGLDKTKLEELNDPLASGLDELPKQPAR